MPSINRSRITLLLRVAQISSAACGYGFTLLSSSTKDLTKLWGMGLNKDSQLGFQRTQKSKRRTIPTASYHYYKK